MRPAPPPLFDLLASTVTAMPTIGQRQSVRLRGFYDDRGHLSPTKLPIEIAQEALTFSDDDAGSRHS